MSNTDKSSKMTTIILLVLMLASTFIGVPLNGGEKGWIYLYYAELSLFTVTVSTASRPIWYIIALSIQTITHLALFALPFLINYKHFYKLLIGLPLLYLILQGVTVYYFLILLIPFMALWGLTMVAWKQR